MLRDRQHVAARSRFARRCVSSVRRKSRVEQLAFLSISAGDHRCRERSPGRMLAWASVLSHEPTWTRRARKLSQSLSRTRLASAEIDLFKPFPPNHSRSSKPVRCGNPTLGRFDSGAAPSSRFWRVRADRGSLGAACRARLKRETHPLRWAHRATHPGLLHEWVLVDHKARRRPGRNQPSRRCVVTPARRRAGPRAPRSRTSCRGCLDVDEQRVPVRAERRPGELVVDRCAGRPTAG